MLLAHFAVLTCLFGEVQPGRTPSSVQATDSTAKPVRVNLRTGLKKWMNEAPLDVFRKEHTGLEPVLSTKLDQLGKCQVDLDPGTYVFEVLHKPEPNLLVALRSEPQEITEACDVRLQASKPRHVKVSLERSASCDLLEFALRSAGPTGDLSWSRPDTGKSDLRVVFTPGESYFARVFAGQRRARFAVWQPLSLKNPQKIAIPISELIVSGFNWLASTPKRRSSWVELSFPHSKLRFEEPEGLEFRTNRRFLELAYGYETKSGKELQFLSRHYELPAAPSEHEFHLGGELSPFAWSEVMLRKVVGSPETRGLKWEAGLRDGSGHHLLEKESDIDWEASIHRKDSRPIPPNPLGPDQVDGLSRKQDLEIKLRYDVTKRQRHTLVPEAWVPVETIQFRTELPAEWESRAVSYLDKLEQVHWIIEEFREERFELQIELLWITNNAGWGRAPFRGRAFIMMPFRGLEFDAHDWFSHPLHMTHEVLHAVGYHHGDEMRAMQDRVQERFERLRWEAVDDPGFVPQK